MTEPTPHDNPDVIAAIAAAMDDWEHHGDAMVYVAPWDEPIVRDPRGPFEEALAHGWDGYAAYAYYGRWHPVSGKALDVMSPGMDGWLGDYRPRWIAVEQPCPGCLTGTTSTSTISEPPPWLDPGPGRSR